MIKFTADGLGFAGPPSGFAATYTATVGMPLELTLWISDEGPKMNIPEPAAAAADGARRRRRGGSRRLHAASTVRRRLERHARRRRREVRRSRGPKIDREHDGKAVTTRRSARRRLRPPRAGQRFNRRRRRRLPVLLDERARQGHRESRPDVRAASESRNWNGNSVPASRTVRSCDHARARCARIQAPVLVGRSSVVS